MNIGGGFGASLPTFALPRVHVSADMGLAEFEAHLSGFHRDFQSRLSGATGVRPFERPQETEVFGKPRPRCSPAYLGL